MCNPNVVVTGAGVSVAAGLPTFRDEGGIWSDLQYLSMSQANRYGNYLDLLIPKWWKLTKAAQAARPTSFHKGIGERAWQVITQNVDGLHQRGGSAEVMEVHGTLVTWRCLRCKKPFPAASQCPFCNKGKVRHGALRRTTEGRKAGAQGRQAG